MTSGVYGDHTLGEDILGYSSSMMLLSEPSATFERVLILSPYFSDKATVIPSSEMASLPAINVLDPEPSKVWRTQGATSQYLNMILPIPVAMNCLALTWLQDAFTDATLVRVRTFNNQADMIANTNALVDTGWDSVWPSEFKHSEYEWGPNVGLYRWDNDVAYQYVRIQFTDPTVGKVYLDISRLALGRAISFVTNPTHNGGLGFVPLDVQEPNGYGQIFTDPRPPQRQMELVWSSLAEKAVTEDVMTLARLRGQAGDFYVFLKPKAVEDFHLFSMQGLFENPHRFSPTPVWMPDKDGESRKGWSFTLTIVQKL